MSTPSPPDPSLVQNRDPAGERLDGWKAIASYLRRDIRTVQRWESTEGLPVRRLEHRQRASAFAFKDELDAWVAARTLGESQGVEPTPAEEDDPSDTAPPPEAGTPAPSSRRRLGLWALLAALAVAVVVLYWFWPARKTSAAAGDTRNSEAYAAFAHGQALYLSRRYRDASISLERAVTLDPGYGIAWAWLGKTYGRLAQPVWAGGPAAAARASETAAKAASLLPDLADSHIALALAARARGDVGQWRAEAARALELDQRAAEALALLGDSYSSVIYSCGIDQNAELAEDYYRRAMELMPGLITTVTNRAGNLRRLGRYGECVDLLNRALHDYPDDTPLLAARGICRLLLGDLEGATADISSVRSNPRLAPAGSLVYQGLLALKSGRIEEGERDLEAFTHYDQSAPSELIAAEAYVVGGFADRALTHIQRALALDATCAPFVSRAIAFAPLRQNASFRALLAEHGVR